MINRRKFLMASVAGLVGSQVPLIAGDRPAHAPPTTSPASEFLTDIPEYPGNILLCRPSDQSITLSLLSHRDVRAQVLFGPVGQARTQKSRVVDLKSFEPATVVLNDLLSSCAYEYEVVDAGDGKALFADRSKGLFRTARKAGEVFTFTIQADSHLDAGCRTDIYATTLQNQLLDAPDFMIDLGDTSMAGKHPSRESALKQYLAQRYYFGLTGHRMPTFWMIGNHDGEENKRPNAGAIDGMATWSNQQRKKYFPNPQPGHFYSGNGTAHPNAGLLENYFAWTWGDALIVILDPYWTSTASRGSSAGWNMSLGKAQYDWLAQTLRQSMAKHKLVFIHQLVGGLDDGGRGGAEAAEVYEWGGRERDGTDTFARLRPGWQKPIHSLLVETGVKFVFHGHDHFYAKQERDGVIYQLAPQAAHQNFRNTHAQEYGYAKGEFFPNSGHLRVNVSADDVKVEYVCSVPPTNPPRSPRRNRDVLSSYTVRA